MNALITIASGILVAYLIRKLIKHYKGYVIKLDLSKQIYSIHLGKKCHRYDIKKLPDHYNISTVDNSNGVLYSNDPTELIDLLELYRSNKIYPSMVSYRYNLNGHEEIYIIRDEYKINTIHLNNTFLVDCIELGHFGEELRYLTYRYSQSTKYQLGPYDLANYFSDYNEAERCIEIKSNTYSVYLGDQVIYKSRYEDDDITITNVINE